MNIRYPIYEGVYRILTLLCAFTETTPMIRANKIINFFIWIEIFVVDK